LGVDKRDEEGEKDRQLLLNRHNSQDPTRARKWTADVAVDIVLSFADQIRKLYSPAVDTSVTISPGFDALYGTSAAAELLDD